MQISGRSGGFKSVRHNTIDPTADGSTEEDDMQKFSGYQGRAIAAGETPAFALPECEGIVSPCTNRRDLLVYPDCVGEGRAGSRT